MTDPLEQIAERAGKKKNWVTSGGVKYYTIDAAAKVTKISKPTLRKYIRKGKVRVVVDMLAVYKSDKWIRKFIPEEEVRRLMPDNRFRYIRGPEIREQLRQEGPGVYDILLQEDCLYDSLSNKIIQKLGHKIGIGLRELSGEVMPDSLKPSYFELLRPSCPLQIPYFTVESLTRKDDLDRKVVSVPTEQYL